MTLFGNKADAGMPHMSSKITFPLTQLPAQAVQNLVIVSNSSLQLPGAIYGLQCSACQVQKRILRLQWVAVCPGAGAAKLAENWG